MENKKDYQDVDIHDNKTAIIDNSGRREWREYQECHHRSNDRGRGFEGGEYRRESFDGDHTNTGINTSNDDRGDPGDRGYRGDHSNNKMMERGGYRRDGDDRGPSSSSSSSRRGRQFEHDNHRFNGNRRRDEYRQYKRYHPEDDDNKRRRLSEDGDHYHNRRHSSDSNRGHYRDDNRDRDRRHRRHSAPSPPTPTTKQVEWPSVFEDSGGSYVFDARSGLFYEAASNYFYDPKNKLYYSNEKKVYYRRYCQKVKEDDKEEGKHGVEGNGDLDEARMWEEVKPEEGAMSAVATATGDANWSNKGGSCNTEGNDVSQNLVLQALKGTRTGSHMANNTNGKNEKKKINICIKKKFTGSANLKKKYLETQEDTGTVATSDINNLLEEKPSLVQKTHHANITKWSTIRTEEMKANENSNNDESNNPNENSSRIIKITKAGKPVCW